ncbi:HpcH/HpaI aldolase family protein [Ramlibacter sp. MAHUQ-53]|uniref:HpcH/HpaI aldolase family protein n=1 Tax=unclassified Ramlibacter TaxID=2617605 RepID=UPI00362713A5
MTDSLKSRIARGDRLAGTFVKTASHQSMEVLCGAGMDFVVIDAEHAPFSPDALDLCLLAARAQGVPALVRVPDTQAGTFLQCLDMGATGLLVPHARTPEGVAEDLKKARYVGGSRGFSNSPRAGGYGQVGMADHIRRADAEVACVFQIEDAEAIEHIEALAALEGVAGYLIGRADLAVSLGCTDIHAEPVVQAVDKVAEACRRHGKPLGIFVTDVAETARWVDQGLSFFIVASDQAFLARQASQVMAQFTQLHRQ